MKSDKSVAYQVGLEQYMPVIIVDADAFNFYKEVHVEGRCTWKKQTLLASNPQFSIAECFAGML